MTAYILFLNPSSLWSHWLSKHLPSHGSSLSSLPSGTSVPSEHTAFRVAQASWRMLQETFPPVMDQIVSPQNSYVEALVLNMTVFGDRTYILINMKWGPTDGSQSDGDSTLIRSGKGTGTCAGSPSLLTCGTAVWGHSNQGAVYNEEDSSHQKPKLPTPITTTVRKKRPTV